MNTSKNVAKATTDQSMLWGSSVDFWDLWGLRLMIAGAAVGAVALVLSLASSFILYKVSAATQSDADKRIADAGAIAASANAAAAKANEAAAKANERAAGLEKEAAELRWSLDREIQKRAPRQLTDEQRKILLAELKGKIPRIHVVVQRDVEAEAFSLQFFVVLQQAGATMHSHKMPPGTSLPLPQGVMMYRPGGARSEDDMKADPLYNALKKSGLFSGFAGRPLLSPELGPDTPMLPPDAHILYIGQKAPW